MLDTYADLLVADGVHALVTGRADLANAAMEAAAGLGAPPELRAIRTPRQATTVRVSAWVLLPPGTAGGGPNADPARVADPAYAAALDVEVEPDAINATDEATRSEARPVRRRRWAAAEDTPLLPSLDGGAYEGLPDSADADLRSAIATDLQARLVRSGRPRSSRRTMRWPPSIRMTRAPTLTSTAAAARWTVDLASLAPADPAMSAPTTAERLAAVVAALAERLSVAASTVPAGAGASPPPDAFISAVRRAIRTVAGRPDLPVLPIVPRSRLPVLRPNADLDAIWLEIVAAVRPRLAPLEASQLDATRPDWAAAVAAPDDSTDPWHPSGPVVVAYGPGISAGGSTVAIAALDGWTDSVPSRRHATTAAFGFNAPKSRAPQAVLVAVPPDLSQRLDNAGLLDVVLETRELAQARAPRQIVEPTFPHPTSTAFVSAMPPRNFLDGWPDMSDPLYLILEPGRTDTDEGLRARVADPVWFITRQWQLGELQGEDASTPVVVTSAPQHVPITYDRSRPDLDPTVIPAEALLEAEPGDWWTVGRRVRLGRAAAPLLDATHARALSARPVAGAVRESGRARSTDAPSSSPVVLAGHAIWAEVPSPAADRWSSSELNYSASFEAGSTALRARDHTRRRCRLVHRRWRSDGGADHPPRSSRAEHGRLFRGDWTIPARRIRAGGSSRIRRSTSAASRPTALTSRRCCCWMSCSSTPTTGSRSPCRRLPIRTTTPSSGVLVTLADVTVRDSFGEVWDLDRSACVGTRRLVALPFRRPSGVAAAGVAGRDRVRTRARCSTKS